MTFWAEVVFRVLYEVKKKKKLLSLLVSLGYSKAGTLLRIRSISGLSVPVAFGSAEHK